MKNKTTLRQLREDNSIDITQEDIDFLVRLGFTPLKI